TTTALEQALVNHLESSQPRASESEAADAPRDEGFMPVVDRQDWPLAQLMRAENRIPSLAGANEWINSAPLSAESLRGKVVLVDFWTYSCINCLRTLPYVRAWAEKYASAGLVVIGVHTPEFAFEKRVANVRQATQDLHIGYP